MSKVILGVIVLLAAGAAGYWFGTRTAPAPAASTAGKTERKILYYRNPMGLPDTSPVPKKDAMGMDYVPVYEGEAGTIQQVSISLDKVQKLGVQSEAAAMRALGTTIRAAARIDIDERRIVTIAPKFDGWTERLYVNTRGQAVGKGQALFDVYSPDLVAAQLEYAIAAQGRATLNRADDDAQKSMQQLAEASLARLKNWDISAAQIAQLEQGKTRRSLTYYAPVSGVVLEKKAVQGMRFMAGEMLYQIADLSKVWVVAEVAEQDIGQVHAGDRIVVTTDAYPGRKLEGRVDFIYPTLNSATRTVPIRTEIANPEGLLKPAMFAQVQIFGAKGKPVLVVPASAVIDSGVRQVVLVQLAPGRFEPRTVKLGNRTEDYVEVLEGIAEGEQVVTSANFLIDAESNLKAALAGFGAHAEPSTAEKHGAAESVQATNADAGLPKSLTVGHLVEGTLDAVDTKAGRVTVTHGPIKSLGWPGMTMDFALANSALATGIPPGSAITFEIVERKPGEWVITKMQAVRPVQAQHQHEGH
ncbi:MAG TPA: efflux RND transporter periplasmic adaptor subunit [Gallionella sp.]|nr:efflux RND transporter periplasmic adaptor subunit [Gallionella sp.]